MRAKAFLYIIIAAITLHACTSDQQPAQQGDGYLRIAGLHIKTETEQIPIKRAVNNSLQVDIYQGTTLVLSYAAGDTDLDSYITLPIGDYKLLAHTPDMNEAADNETGTPIYYAEKEFTISHNQLTTVDALTATQVNAGIRIEYQDKEFATGFSKLSCMLTSTETGRTVAIEGANDNSLYYFSIPGNGEIKYQITATNTDGESFSLAPGVLQVDAPKNYYLSIKMQ